MNQGNSFDNVAGQLIIRSSRTKIVLNDNTNRHLNSASSSTTSASENRKNEGNATILAVPVPPLISQVVMEMMERKMEGSKDGDLDTTRIAQSFSVGRLIHPCLDHLPLHQLIISSEQEDNHWKRPANSPADIISFTLPADDSRSVKEIIEKIHGEAMSSASFAAIKPFAISDMIYHCPCTEVKFSTIHHDNNRNNGNASSSDVAARADTDDTTTTRAGTEIPACPACLHRIDPVRLGCPPPKKYQLCSHHESTKSNESKCKNRTFLTPWPPPSNCTACSLMQSYAISMMMREEAMYSDATLEQQLRSSLTIVDAANSNTPHQIRSVEATSIKSYHSASERVDNQQSSNIASAGRQKNLQTILRCSDCEMKETLWVCLTCGFIGCGRYSHGHAVNHFHLTDHPFSLELATGRIWAYTDAEYVQRTDFSKCPFTSGNGSGFYNSASSTSFGIDNGNNLALANSFQSTTTASKSVDNNGSNYHCQHSNNSMHIESDQKKYQETKCKDSSFNSTSCGAITGTVYQQDQESPKKAILIGEIYEALLSSALEDQSQHYEGELVRLRAELAAGEVRQVTPEEKSEIDLLTDAICQLRIDADKLSKENLDIVGQEAGYRASYERQLREQQVQKQLYERIKLETARERAEGELQIEELEQQLRDLNAYLKIQQEVSQNQEVRNSRILFGTSTNNQKSSKPGISGKKTRRIFRRGG